MSLAGSSSEDSASKPKRIIKAVLCSVATQPGPPQPRPTPQPTHTPTGVTSPTHTPTAGADQAVDRQLLATPVEGCLPLPANREVFAAVEVLRLGPSAGSAA